MRGFVQRYPLLEDARISWSDILDPAVVAEIRGKRIHDARLVALMRASGLTDILSFDSHMDAFEETPRHVPTVQPG